MPINISSSNYINTQTAGTSNGQVVSGSVSISSSDGAVVSVKGLDLSAGQTLSGQVVEIDGKDIKLLLSNNQTINARLEGNINALLGQTLSFEVKGTENGQTALRPLYTNLNNSQTVSNALQNAGLPVTENYVKMVSAMMDEGMPINKNAIYEMSKHVNNFANANPETLVQLNKLGLQINELTINQYDNYKGLEHQIIGDVENLAKGVSDLLSDSLENVINDLNTASAEAATLNETETSGVKQPGSNILSAFLNALTRGNAGEDVTGTKNEELLSDKRLEETTDTAIDNAMLDEVDSLAGEGVAGKTIAPSDFDTAGMILDLIDTTKTENSAGSEEGSKVSPDLKNIADEIINSLKQDISDNARNIGKDSILRDIAAESNIKNIENKNDVLNLAKDVLSQLKATPENVSEHVKEHLAKLLTSNEFGDVVKNSISKQMLLRPQEVVNSKNIEELYSRIVKQASQVLEMLENSGKSNPELMNAAKNISDNVTFMNELNQVVTYVQLPLLMNNKSAHGDLYVYTNKKSLKNNDGNISAFLHLDMDNLGPMDIYVALSNNTKVNTKFYLQDEETIDFLEAHIDRLNKRLTEKGYDMNMNFSIKDNAKGPVNIAKEFMKDDPATEGISAAKYSFDVRA